MFQKQSIYQLINHLLLKRYILLLCFCLIAISICFCACKKKEPDISQTVLKIKELGELVTTQYTLSKIVKASDDKTWYKVGDRKIIMSCEANIKAGVDLQHITEKNVTIEDSTIALQLPPARIFSLSIPPDKIQVRYSSVDMLRDPFSAAERQTLLAQAELQMGQLADSLGILKTAQDNAVVYLQSLLQQSGFNKVTISFTKP